MPQYQVNNLTVGNVISSIKNNEIATPETDQPTEITPIKLVKDGDKLQLTYKVKRGEKTTSTMVPCLVLVVDNANKGKLELK